MEIVKHSKVKFSEFRNFESARKDANDSMSALLVGSRLAAHQLALHGSSQAYLPQVYPGVKGVSLLNRRVGDARDLLAGSEQHLAYMAIPYVQAVYEFLLESVLTILQFAGMRQPTKPELSSGLPGRLGYIVDVTNLGFDPVHRELLDLVRYMRNAMMHSAGRRPHSAIEAWEGLTDGARDRWTSITKRGVGVESDQLVVGSYEMVAALAIMKFCARELNGQLSASLNAKQWAHIVVADFASSHVQGLSPRPTLERELCGWQRWYYSELEIEKKDLISEVEAAERVVIGRPPGRR